MKELKVKPGDKVLYQFYALWDIIEEIKTVIKVTHGGKVKVEGIDTYFDKYGNGIDIRELLSIPAETDYKRVKEKNTIKNALSLIDNLNMENLSYDKALKIVEILSTE